jgi:hypothetical protein
MFSLPGKVCLIADSSVIKAYGMEVIGFLSTDNNSFIISH